MSFVTLPRTALATTALVAAALAAAALASPAALAAHTARAGRVEDADGMPPCRAGETAVVVVTARHRLFLCEAGQPQRGFDVSLGMGGVDKRRQGDNKTPLGTYGLGPAHASGSFHVFIPVGYPTTEQARQGFTGSAVGIHGPPRGFSGWLARARLLALDWTAGCIAVGSDDEIDAIAAWMRQHAVRRVRLEPPSAAPGSD